ncbi:MAG TPA: ThiF family adenylyltransferase [Candidatus Sulfotelmatobacter sp.]|jgi:molybdopterin/thiamine biosynthesis adenylyltransferase|nr:ThiF family adenylyltransferase [Candidatus Sulfotelmatobacter sp.]
MLRLTFTVLDEHYKKLRALLFRDENEYGALMLCGRSRQVDPWTGVVEERALVREVVEVPEEAFLKRTPMSLVWSTTPLYNLAKRAIPKDCAICIAHSHPRGGLFFSDLDDVADRESFEIVFGRTETERPHFAMVMDNQGELLVRGYGPDLKPQAAELTRIIGDRLRIRYPGRGNGVPTPEFDRQMRVFGAQSVEDLAQLRVGIIGCGGTGSAVASLLARAGVRRFVLIDADRVDETNLNRLHFSTRADAIARRLKVDVVGDAIAQMGLARSVVRLAHFVDAPECRDAIRSCDVIFGCTDDHLGRSLLNRLAHFYLIPVIDLGVLIEPNNEGHYDSFDGRVTVVQPSYPCQVCRQLISPQRMLEESLRRHDPQVYEQYRRAGYIEGGTDPSPVVVTFTTEIAAVAVNELLHRLTGFRGQNGHCAERVRRFDWIKDADIIAGGRRNPDCPLCGQRRFDGRGDMTPFLNQTS